MGAGAVAAGGAVAEGTLGAALSEITAAALGEIIAIPAIGAALLYGVYNEVNAWVNPPSLSEDEIEWDRRRMEQRKFEEKAKQEESSIPVAAQECPQGESEDEGGKSDKGGPNPDQEPRNLQEEKLLEEARAGEAAGTNESMGPVKNDKLADRIGVPKENLDKMRGPQSVNDMGVNKEVHYVRDRVTGKTYEWKIKEQLPKNTQHVSPTGQRPGN